VGILLYVKIKSNMQLKDMRTVIQRVKQASVSVDSQVVGKIGPGFLLLLGFGAEDKQETPPTQEFRKLIEKIINLRIFSDNDKKFNLSLLDLNYQLLVVSQFTLYADCNKGRRPEFFSALEPQLAKQYFEEFVKTCELLIPGKVQTGTFGAYMQVELVNDGPVTITF
jgi:D-tyrosyl-tRNA(Tyr) deacylase